MAQKLSLSQFIEKAKAVHGDKYDYTKSVYMGVDTKLTITCPVHGDFEQTPYVHFKGGCPKCGFLILGTYRKLTFDDFVMRATAKHGDKYDYSKSNYVNTTTKLTITCPVHGDFEQTPERHMSGQGCVKCGREKLSSALRLSLDDFVTRAAAKHNDEYDYNKSVYVNGRTKLIITCPTHGDFEQQPANHLNGSGCPVCKGKAPLTPDRFMERAKKTHGDRYEYHLDKMMSTKEKMLITCHEHGIFEQNANNHLNGAGCPKCASSKGEKAVMRILEKHYIPYTIEYKLPNYRYKYDFYLPAHNVFIEFHGVQHYEYVDFFHRTEKQYRYKKEIDLFKLNLAKEHGIPVLYFDDKHLKLTEDEFEKLIVSSLESMKARKSKRWFFHRY